MIKTDQETRGPSIKERSSQAVKKITENVNSLPPSEAKVLQVQVYQVLNLLILQNDRLILSKYNEHE